MMSFKKLPAWRNFARCVATLSLFWDRVTLATPIHSLLTFATLFLVLRSRPYSPHLPAMPTPPT